MNPRRLPRVVHLGPYRVRVALVSQTILREVVDDDETGQYYKGAWDEELSEGHLEAGTIYIDRRLPAHERWETFWHELAHALTDVASWDRELRARKG